MHTNMEVEHVLKVEDLKKIIGLTKKEKVRIMLRKERMIGKENLQALVHFLSTGERDEIGFCWRSHKNASILAAILFRSSKTSCPSSFPRQLWTMGARLAALAPRLRSATPAWCSGRRGTLGRGTSTSAPRSASSRTWEPPRRYHKINNHTIPFVIYLFFLFHKIMLFCLFYISIFYVCWCIYLERK